MKKNLQIGKKIALALLLLITASVVNAADRYARATGNWNATATWSATPGGAPGASIPVAGDNVYIINGYNVTIPDAVTVACTNLNVTIATSTGTGTITFGGTTATLNVSGNVTVGTATSGSREGVINMSSGGVLTIGGNLTIGNEGASTPIASEVVQGANSSISVTGNVSILTPNTNNYANQWQVNAGTASVTGTLTLANTGGNSQDCNVIVTTGTLSVDGTITMSGAAAENSISITGAGTFNIGGTFTTTGGTFSPSATSTVNYDGAAQTIRGATYATLVLSGSGSKTLTGVTVNDKLSVQGTATVGTTFTYSSAILEYKGSAAQTTSNNEFPTAGTGITQLIIDNAAGVTLNNAKALAGILNMTNGDLVTTNTNLLTIAAGGSISGGSASSHVNGPLAKTGSTNFTFPIGNGTLYRPITVSSLSASATVRATYFLSNPRTAFGTNGTGTSQTIKDISLCEYWDLDDGASTITGVVGLQYSSTSPCNGGGYIGDPSALLVAHFTAGAWQNLGAAPGATGTNMTAATASSFSPFTIGTSDAGLNGLPVTFTNVKAFEKGNGVQIDFTNSTESDMSEYVIERSANGVDFTAIGQLAPRSNQFDVVRYTFLDAAPLAGTNFYRVKAVELTGKNVFSKALRVDIGRSPKGISLYPNPVRGSEITIGFSAIKGLYNLNVVNTAGQVVYRQSLNHAGGTVAQTVSLPAALKAGVYNVLISGDNYKETKTFVIQ